MPATAERIAFVSEEYRSALWKSDAVHDLYGKVARDTKEEPFESFFDDPLDAQKILNERGLLIGSHARRFRVVVGRVLLEDEIDLSQAVPSATIIDDELVADMTAAIVAVESVDLENERTTLNLWGVIGAAPYSLAEAVGQAGGEGAAEAVGLGVTIGEGVGSAAGAGAAAAGAAGVVAGAGTAAGAGEGDATGALGGLDTGAGDADGIGTASGAGGSIAAAAGTAAGTGTANGIETPANALQLDAKTLQLNAEDLTLGA